MSHPSKSIMNSWMDYLSEMNRLFPGNEQDDTSAPFSINQSYHSPYQSAMYNRSSSSTDSTSPESYPDVSMHSPQFSKPQEIPKPPQDSTFTIRRQRAIVGRKILGNTQQMSNIASSVEKDIDYNIWQLEEPLLETPPENSIPSQSLYYGLFPEKNVEFKTPVKSNQTSDFSLYPNNRSPIFSLRSPTGQSSMISPAFSNQSYRSQVVSNQPQAPTLSPTWSVSSHNSSLNLQRPTSRFSGNFSNLHSTSKYPNLGASSSTDEIAPTKMCTFCRKNGETPIVYMTHCVKEKVGNKNVVTCPILRSHKCATCGASGDDAHTITYCPILRSTNNGKPLQSTTITLKNTRIKSNGRRRY